MRHFFEATPHNLLIFLTNTSKSNSLDVLGELSRKVITTVFNDQFQRIEDLTGRNGRRHECWRHVLVFPFDQGFGRFFFDFDVCNGNKIFIFKFQNINVNCLPSKHKVCNFDRRFLMIFSTKLVGFQPSVQSGIDTTSPKLYNCKPAQPQALMMDAL